MAVCSQDAVCLLCEENITFTVKDFACVSRKGLAAINDFSVKYNELNPVKTIPIHAFDDNEKQYVHERCRKAHTNTR